MSGYLIFMDIIILSCISKGTAHLTKEDMVVFQDRAKKELNRTQSLCLAPYLTQTSTECHTNAHINLQ